MCKCIIFKKERKKIMPYNKYGLTSLLDPYRKIRNQFFLDCPITLELTSSSVNRNYLLAQYDVFFHLFIYYLFSKSQNRDIQFYNLAKHFLQGIKQKYSNIAFFCFCCVTFDENARARFQKLADLFSGTIFLIRKILMKSVCSPKT